MVGVITDEDSVKFDLLRQFLKCGELPPSYLDFLEALRAHIGPILAHVLSEGNARAAQQAP